MQSVLAEFHTVDQHEICESWQRNTNAPLHSGRLWKTNSLKESEEVYGQVFANYLVIKSGDSKKMAEKLCMKCALVEPFTYLAGTKAYFGFALNYPDTVIELLTPDSDELDTWISHLKTVTTFLGFDEDYALGERINNGGWGSVHWAKSAVTKDYYAVKIISKDNLANHTHGLLYSKREIETMRVCSSHKLVNLHATYEDLDSIYLVIDLFNEGTLLDLLHCSGPIEEELAKTLARSLLEGLVYLHANGIIHRDIKLENLLLQNHTNCVIADMGLSRFVGADGTVSGEKCGSIGYVAPEVFCSPSYNCKADVFSAGCVVYSLLTGTAPFGTDPNRVGMLNASNRVQYDRADWRRLSEDALAFVMSLMTKNPDQRLTAA